MNAIKQRILEQAQHDGVQVTALREQVFDIALKQSGVIKTYNALPQMQQQSEGMVTPPTTCCAPDFWAEQDVLHRVATVSGYILCDHAQHECNDHCHDYEETETYHSAFILVRTECSTAGEQALSQGWATLRTDVAETGFPLKEEHVVLTGICKKCQK